jgi:hypothetical protein
VNTAPPCALGLLLRGIQVVSGAGHWLPQEAPNAVNAALLEFLGREAQAQVQLNLEESYKPSSHELRQ